MSNNEKMKAPEGLKMLFTVVNGSKAEFYIDLIQSFGANIQTFVPAEGTAKSETLGLLGFSDQHKCLIISIIRSDKADSALKSLEDKFRTVKNGKGIAFTTPFCSMVGASAYKFLANIRDKI